MEEKRCSRCKLELPIKEFSSNGTSAKGTSVYRASCKSCERKRISLIRKNNPAYLEQQVEQRRNKNKKKKQVDDYIKNHLTFLLQCSLCDKTFVVTTLPELPDKVVLTCKSCQAGISMEADNADS